MALEKAKIIVLDQTGDKEVETIPVMFNPSEYTINKSSNYKHLKHNKYQHTSAEPAKLSMELFFNCDKVYVGSELIDEYDVRNYTSKLMNLLNQGEKNNPRWCKFKWGGFEFKCFVSSLTQRFTMFNESGMPIRAVVNIEFIEYMKPEDDKESYKEQKSIDNKSEYNYSELCNAAYEYFKDPKRWREIADANGNNTKIRFE